MLSSTSADLEKRCVRLVESIGDLKLEAEIIQGRSAVGGGAAPTFEPESPLIFLQHPEVSARE